MQYQSGFSLVELIMVMLLIGILSAGAFGLFANKSDFSARAARESFVAIAALAQQRALVAIGDNATDQVTLSITQSANDWQVQLGQSVFFNGSNRGSNNLQIITIDRDGGSLNIDGTNLADGDTETITYTKRGRLAAAKELTFTSASNTQALCISQTGFPYPQACQ